MTTADWPSQLFNLIVSDDWTRAEAMVAALREAIDDDMMHRLLSLEALLDFRRGNTSEALSKIGQARALMPSLISHVHRHAEFLFDLARWSEAADAYGEAARLCEDQADVFFLDDARSRRVVCLRRLGLHSEAEAEKAAIADDFEGFIGDRLVSKADL